MAAALAAAATIAPALRAQEWRDNPIPPTRVAVRPVFLVPPGAAAPTAGQLTALMRHLRLARDRYTALLEGRDSFTLDTAVLVVPVSRRASYYRSRPEDGVPDLVGELLDRLRVSRFACPWIFVAVMMHPDTDWPVGGGRPLNGGLNTGGGIVVLSSYALDRIPNVQSTIQHELGHSFGLPHVDVYGRDMQADASLMSYNPGHHTSGFAASRTPGMLAREDRRALARNTRVFAHLVPEPSGTPPRLVMLGPMDITGHPPAIIRATTPSGERYGTRAQNAVQQDVPTNAGPGVTFDPSRMWQSDSSVTGWVTLDVEFPVPVTLTRIGIHSQHSGRYHVAARGRVWLVEGDVGLQLADTPFAGADAEARFVAATGRHWRVDLQAAERGQVVVRGLRFFNEDTAIVIGGK